MFFSSLTFSNLFYPFSLRLNHAISQELPIQLLVLSLAVTTLLSLTLSTS